MSWPSLQANRPLHPSTGSVEISARPEWTSRTGRPFAHSSTNEMSVTLDANVLVYASNEADPVHGPARGLQFGVGVIYTRDRGFRRFEGIEARDPFA